jgi:hypothetical protein
MTEKVLIIGAYFNEDIFLCTWKILQIIRFLLGVIGTGTPKTNPFVILLHCLGVIFTKKSVNQTLNTSSYWIKVQHGGNNCIDRLCYQLFFKCNKKIIPILDNERKP